MGICCMAEETQTGALYQPRGVGWGGKWQKGSRGRGYVYLWLIHVDIWQKTTKFCNYPSIKINKKKERNDS